MSITSRWTLNISATLKVSRKLLMNGAWLINLFATSGTLYPYITNWLEKIIFFAWKPISFYIPIPERDICAGNETLSHNNPLLGPSNDTILTDERFALYGNVSLNSWSLKKIPNSLSLHSKVILNRSPTIKFGISHRISVSQPFKKREFKTVCPCCLIFGLKSTCKK